MKLISWNIDSINAAVEHSSARGEMTWETLQNIATMAPDVVAIQETKLRPTGLTKKQATAIEELFPEYHKFLSFSTARKGYAGTMMLTKEAPVSVTYPEIGAPGEMDQEGRIITLEFAEYFVSTVYTPNSGSDLARLTDRQAWDDAYRMYIQSLDEQKPVIFSGDFNVAHQEIDLKNPKTNHHSAGFTDEERVKFGELLDAGFTDIFRYQNPEAENIYTWWAQISKTSKINNSGWRIDYYLVSERIKDTVKSFEVIDTGARKDHAPIMIELEH
ncbi:exodeoxyribonuclease III [Weissella soli]|uniref:Exodeoxyribonuclease n=1 Tax=Weissella soli TaxID=155866 RepID=A0A288Q833_9LACO|nr:exodeoxyribonuclease III [Weissella soli]AOT55700.1 Exodeoxyribonuclease III [Weissella soli]NKY83513.1 exodeoxyribonuclease III [Weissella soli]RDL06626.1 exodeoxyribonuclease-3 [Weissella soli]GEN93322.1 exodeoxyribonuclease [Weissella soli]